MHCTRHDHASLAIWVAMRADETLKSPASACETSAVSSWPSVKDSKFAFMRLLPWGQLGGLEADADSVEPESMGKLGTGWDATEGPENARSWAKGACWGAGVHSAGTAFPNDAGGIQHDGSTGGPAVIGGDDCTRGTCPGMAMIEAGG